MYSLISDSIYRLGPDQDGFRLDRHPPQEPRYPEQVWEVVFPRELVSRWESVLLAGQRPEPYLLSFVVLISGERPQRRAIGRMLASGSRNIRLGVRQFREYVDKSVESILSREEWSLINDVDCDLKRGVVVPTERLAEADRLANRYSDLAKRTVERMNDELRTMMQRYHLPIIPAEKLVSYEITPETINLTADRDCQGYLRRVQGTEREPIFLDRLTEICANLRERFPEDAPLLTEHIKSSKTLSLSALSLSSEQDKLLVTIVNPVGKHVRVEAWKLLNLVKEKGKTQRWGALVRKSHDVPEPLLKFSQQKSGVLYAKLWPDRVCIEVVCRPETETDDLPKVKSVPSEQAWFYVDPEYLVCLAAAIERLHEDHKRFLELMEIAETKLIYDPLDREYW